MHLQSGIKLIALGIIPYIDNDIQVFNVSQPGNRHPKPSQPELATLQGVLRCNHPSLSLEF